jgi:methionine synthase I (cobalamin-dependent)
VANDATVRFAADESSSGHRCNVLRHSATMSSACPWAEVLDLRVIGGCCGTDHEHVHAVYDRLTVSPAT